MESQRFKYGMNPDQQASFQQVAEACSIDGEPLSLNAYLDVQTGGSVIESIGGSVKIAVYVKHRTPLLVSIGDTAKVVCGKLAGMVRACGNIEFGCVVTNFSMSNENLDLLTDLRMHTLAAPGFDDAFLHDLASAETQQRHRRIVAVPLSRPSAVNEIQLRFAAGGMVSFQDRPAKIAQEMEGIKNSLWRLPKAHLAGLSVLAHSRTISVVVLVDGDVAFVRAGFFDGIEALSQTLQLAADAGVSLENATVLTDGCFGIKLPTQTLLTHGVKSFMFAGGKPNDGVVVLDLEANGVGAWCSKTRYFSF